MGYARYIGRVGGLAVALGVGVGVAVNPGAALADEQAPGSPDTTSSQAVDQPPGDTAAGSAGSAGSEGSKVSEGSTGSGGAADDSGGDPADTDDGMKVDSSGGAITSTTPGSAGAEESSDTEGSGAEPTTGRRQQAEKSGSDSPPPPSSTPKKPKPAALDTTDTTSVRTDTGSSVSRSASEPDQLPSAGAGEVTVQRTVQSPAASAEPVSSQRVVIEESPVVLDPAASRWMSSMLSWIGLSSSATGDVPSVPGGSPVALAVLAAWRRMSQQASSGDASSLRSVEDTGTSLMMAAAAVNSPPTASPAVGTANAATGAVTVNLNGADPDGNPLTYAVTTQPADGSLTTTVPGVYAFTPTQAARLRAGQTAGPDSNSFTVTISDGQGGSIPVTVSVPVSPTQVGAPSSVGVGSNPSGVAVNGSRVFVVNASANTLTVYDTANNNALVRTVNVGAAPTSVVVSSNGSTVWVANSGGSTVSRIDTTSWQVSSVNVGTAPRGLALSPDGSTLWVANSGSNSVSRINTATNAVSAPIGVGWGPQAIAVSPDGASVWVANTSGNTVQRINTATNAAGAHIYVGWVPSGIAVTNDRVLVSNQYSNSVSVVSVATGQVSTVNVGPAPTAITLSADRSLAFVANSDDTVSIIDTRANAVIRTVAVDSVAESGAHGITVGADGRIYVTDVWDNSLRILSVRGVNSAPTTSAATVGTPNATTGVVTGQITANDIDGDTLTYTVTVLPANGSTVAVNATSGGYTFSPSQAARNLAAQPGGPQSATFTVTVSDGLASTTRQVTVPVLPAAVANHPPVAYAGPSMNDPNGITGEVTFLVNVSDPDRDPLTYTVTTPPTKGTVGPFDPNGSYPDLFRYRPTQAARDLALQTPGPDTDTFTITVSDGQASVQYVVTVPVQPANRPPAASAIPTVGTPNSVNGTVTGTLNVTDPDGNPLTYTVLTAPANGGVTVGDNGSFAYTPTQQARQLAAQTPNSDADSFVVRVTDTQYAVDVTVTVPISPTNQSVTSNAVAVGSGASGVVVSGNGPNVVNPNRAYVVNTDSNSVSVIDTTTNTVTRTITVGPSPLSIAISPDGARVYVTNSVDNTVSVINTTTLTVVKNVQVHVEPTFNPEAGDLPNVVADVVVSPDGKRIYVTATDGGISVIETTNFVDYAVSSRHLVGYYSDLKISADGRRLYGTHYGYYGGPSVVVIDASSTTLTVLDTINVGPTWNLDLTQSEFANNTYNVALSADGRRMYVSYGVTTVARGTGGHTSGSFIVDSRGQTWLVTGGYTAVAVFDINPTTGSRTEVARVKVDAGAQDVALSSDGSVLYVTGWDGKSVTMIDTGTNTVSGGFTTDVSPSVTPRSLTFYGEGYFNRFIAVGPDGSIYVTDYDDGMLYRAADGSSGVV